MSPRDLRVRRQASKIRADLQLIADMIEPGARVLDIGCGDGALLEHLAFAKQGTGRGIELSQEGVNACVSQGLSVIQGDADTDLTDYPAGAFDYAILSQTLQATHDPRHVLEQLVRIGRRAIVSFPNFGHYRTLASVPSSLTRRLIFCPSDSPTNTMRCFLAVACSIRLRWKARLS